MKQITLTDDTNVLIDDAYRKVAKYTWYPFVASDGQTYQVTKVVRDGEEILIEIGVFVHTTCEDIDTFLDSVDLDDQPSELYGETCTGKSTKLDSFDEVIRSKAKSPLESVKLIGIKPGKSSRIFSSQNSGQ